MDDKIKREPICLSTAGKCDCCKKRSAVITDGTYVYCSNNCKKEFMDNAMEALRDPFTQLGKQNENR